ncbi:Clp protease N-terminal domain-containing protein [Nocardiopsis sp. RSe5-2]|uniref:Clp protease N-terminal domain-containing protein n=1 Tax=Nocardiopsis endophytica TaxID=3018445 RepID=A0ABT4TYS4_9ACTN|nr:Clp protease N-terminal domain-containing protein [Nocardiopsis endophytica]MDA2809851.1 Clp protease N-terminal domain-containing protein [Nocardiopsis endophytica]
MSDTAFTPRLQQAVARARRIAAEHGVTDDAGRPVVGTEHLFLAILDDGYAVPTQALEERHNVESLKEAVLRVMRTPEYRGRTPPA